MGQWREIVVHLVRTLALCLGGAALLYATIYATIYFRLSPYLMFALIFGGIAAWVYFSARWHPYWAPIAKPVHRKRWVREDGAKMLTVVEVSIVETQAARLETYRISIYKQPGMWRIRRRVLGDDVVFLGRIREGLWFYIHDPFYARKDGLVCVDARSGDWIYHQPQSKVQFVESIQGQTGTIEVIWAGTPKRLDLDQLEHSPTALDA